MMRTSLIMILTGVLLALPVLCAGGWVVHPCECGPELGCDHELECAADPCDFDLYRHDSSTASPTYCFQADAGIPGPLIAVPSSSQTVRVPRLVHRMHGGLPFPLSDLPLLI